MNSDFFLFFAFVASKEVAVIKRLFGLIAIRASHLVVSHC